MAQPERHEAPGGSPMRGAGLSSPLPSSEPPAPAAGAAATTAAAAEAEAGEAPAEEEYALIRVPEDPTEAAAAAAAAAASLPVPKAWLKEPSKVRVAGTLALGVDLWCICVSFLTFVLAMTAAEEPIDYASAVLEIICAGAIAYLGAYAAIKRGQ